MTTQTAAVDIHIRAHDQAGAVLDHLTKRAQALTRSLAALARIKIPPLSAGTSPEQATRAAAALRATAQAQAAASRAQVTAERQLGRQRAAEAQAETRRRATFDSAALRTFRQSMRFAQAMARQRLSAEREATREAERAAAATDRQEAAAERRRAQVGRQRASQRDRQDRQERQEQERSRRETIGRGRDVLHRGRDVHHDIVRPAGFAGLAASAATVAATRRVLSSEVRVDEAETRTRAYGGLSQQAARQLRDQWAAPTAEALGSGTAELLTAWTDATKLGVPAAGAKAFAELSTKTSEAWEVPFGEVTDIMGTINSLLTSSGAAFSIDRLKSVANTIQHLAAKQSTTPEKMLSFLQRGAGASQVLGMSQEAGLAFGSASTSLGNQAGSSGRLFDYLASRLIELPRLTKQTGDEGRQARELVQALGYGSAEALDRRRRADPDAFLPDFMDRFNKIKNPKKQDQALRFFAGREWLGELGRLVKGADTYREAVQLSREAKKLDAIGEVWAMHQTKLRFVFKQFRAGWANILGEAGKEFSPIARQIGDAFLGWTARLRGGQLQRRVKGALEGLVKGLGFDNVPALMEGIFGKPGSHSFGSVETWRSAAQGFGEGLRDLGNAARSFLSLFTGGSTDPQVIGRWTARILGFGAVLLVAAPAISALTAFSTAILAIGVAASTAMTAISGIGALAGGGAAAAGGAAGIGALVGGAALPVTLVAISAAVVAAIWGKEALRGLFQGVPSGDGGKPRTGLDDLGAELGAVGPRARQREWVDPPAKVQRQSYFDGEAHNGAFDRRLIHKASLSNDETVASLNRLSRAMSEKAWPGATPGRRSWSSWAGLPTRDHLEEARLENALRPHLSDPAGSLSASPRALGSVSGGPRVPRFYGSASGGAGASDNSPIAPVKGKTFGEVGPRLMADLQKDFGISKVQAAAIVGNLGHESGGFTAFQEKNPLGGGRGGWGYAQWTGPRRRQFEAWAQARGLDPKSYEANYGFLRHELQTTEKGGLAAVKRHDTLEGGTVAFERAFERAGIKHDASRLKWARRAAGLPEVAAGVKGPADPKAALSASPAAQDTAQRGFTSSGWKRPDGSTPAPSAASVPVMGKPSPAEAAAAVPQLRQLSPWRSPAEGSGQPGSSSPGGGQGGSSVVIHQTINGAGQDPAALANSVQRHITEAWNFRAHDLEPELT